MIRSPLDVEPTDALGGVPLTITVIGNSIPVLRFGDSDGPPAFPRALERGLSRDGIPTRVHNNARMFELVHEGRERWFEAVVSTYPEVLIINYGVLEMQPGVVPTSIVRSFTSERYGGLFGRFTPKVRRKAWAPLRRWQQLASARVGMRTWRLAPDAFAHDLEFMIRRGRRCGATVLVCDVIEPGSRLQHWMPGLIPRWQHVQGVIADAVRRVDDPEVRFVSVADVVAPLGVDVLPDGLHLTGVGHAAVAEVLQAEVVAAGLRRGWLRERS